MAAGFMAGLVCIALGILFLLLAGAILSQASGIIPITTADVGDQMKSGMGIVFLILGLIALISGVLMLVSSFNNISGGSR